MFGGEEFLRLGVRKSHGRGLVFLRLRVRSSYGRSGVSFLMFSG